MTGTWWFFVLAPLLGVCYNILCALTPTRRPPHKDELRCFNLETKKTNIAVGDVHAEAEVELSLVVPAYNESKRLPTMLDATLAYLDARKKKQKDFSYEIIIVDDGSKDNTYDIACEYATKVKNKYMRVVKLVQNRGKGGAVVHGMSIARGEKILFVDADGASKIDEVERLEAALGDLKKNEAVAIGSRAHMAVDAKSLIRTVLSRSFHLVINALGVRGIGDTQCGFKLFSRSAAAQICPNMHVERWIFDIEMLMLARAFDIPIAEVPIEWEEVDGSKMDLASDSLKMLKDLLVIRLNYLLGRWKADPNKKRV